MKTISFGNFKPTLDFTPVLAERQQVGQEEGESADTECFTSLHPSRPCGVARRLVAVVVNACKAKGRMSMVLLHWTDSSKQEAMIWRRTKLLTIGVDVSSRK